MWRDDEKYVESEAHHDKIKPSVKGLRIKLWLCLEIFILFMFRLFSLLFITLHLMGGIYSISNSFCGITMTTSPSLYSAEAQEVNDHVVQAALGCLLFHSSFSGKWVFEDSSIKIFFMYFYVSFHPRLWTEYKLFFTLIWVSELRCGFQHGRSTTRCLFLWCCPLSKWNTCIILFVSTLTHFPHWRHFDQA